MRLIVKTTNVLVFIIAIPFFIWGTVLIQKQVLDGPPTGIMKPFHQIVDIVTEEMSAGQ